MVLCHIYRKYITYIYLFNTGFTFKIALIFGCGRKFHVFVSSLLCWLSFVQLLFLVGFDLIKIVSCWCLCGLVRVLLLLFGFWVFN